MTSEYSVLIIVSFISASVIMAQEFKNGMVLVDGHGNFGSIEGDSAAAMRYTEARLARVTQEAYLSDLDKDVVDFVPNFDETEKAGYVSEPALSRPAHLEALWQ